MEKEAKERAEREEKERMEREKKEKAEKEAREKAEKEREAKEKAEKEAREKAEREAKEKAEKEKKEKERAEKEAKEKAEKEAKEKLERESKEKAEKEKAAAATKENIIKSTPSSPLLSASPGPKSLIAERFNASSDKEDEAEAKARKRLDDAVRWVDKEIRKLIAEIIKLTPINPNPRTINYGTLFNATQHSMEALSGTLMTAKKRGVVDYDGGLLLQRIHDNIIITLKKEEIPDSPLPDHSKRKTAPIKSGGFETKTVGGVELCASCGKSVYPAERVGAAGKVFHNFGICFSCTECKKKLEPTEYCNVNNKNYCKRCFTALSNAKGLNF